MTVSSESFDSEEPGGCALDLGEGCRIMTVVTDLGAFVLASILVPHLCPDL